MARFKTTGIDEVLNEMKHMGELTGEVADRMLMAGAEAVKEAWRDTARKHDLKDTGDMIESIGYAKAPKTAGDVRQIDIYPQGKDRTGTRNAEKAFILHYGSSSINATHWVDEADDAAAVPVQETYEKIWNEFIEGEK